MSASSNNMDRRQRLREQMRQFYGDPNAAGNSANRRAQDGGRRNPGVAPEMDLDSEYFNVSKYTTDLLRRETLKGLVESDTELLRSVRKLDGELQELVYRNYAKFISATDTIREMRDNVSHMDNKLQALSTNVTSIDETSQAISDRLQEHHSRIESTITTNRMLRKIQFLVELPATMRQLLDRQEYGVAVKYWVAGDGFLTKHASIASIAKIQTECHGLAKELYAKMEQAMCAVSLDDPEAMDSIRGHVENLRLLRATTLFSAEEQRRDEGSTSFDEAILKVLMGGVSANFNSGVAAAQRDIKGALIAPGSLHTMELAKRGDTLAQVSLREALAQLKSSCALLAVNSERVYSLLNKLDGSKVAMRVAQEVQPVLIDLLTPIRKQLAELAVAVLQSIGDEGLIALDTPEAVSAAMQSAVASFMKQMKHIAVTLKTLSANYLDTMHSHQSHAYAGMVDQALGEVLGVVARALKNKAWQQPDTAAARAMVGSYTATEQPAASALAAHTAPQLSTLGSAAQRGSDAAAQRAAFAVSRWVYASTAARLAEECAAQLVQAETISAESVKDALDGLAEAAQLLLHRGVVLVGQLEVRAMAEVGFGNPADAADPTLPAAQGGGVHPALTALIRHDWAKLSAVLEALPPAIPKDPQPPNAAAFKAAGGTGASSSAMLSMGTSAAYTGRLFPTSSAGGRSSTAPRTAGGGGKPTVSYTRREDVTLQSSVDRIFSAGEGAAALRTMPRDGRAGTVMACVVMYLLKGIVTFVRAAVGARPYSQHAFQRLQLHATCLLRALVAGQKGTAARRWAKTWDDGTTRAIQQQLDECCCCAYERYEAKVPLSNAALEKILEEAAATANADAGRRAAAPPATAPAATAAVYVPASTPPAEEPVPAMAPVEVAPTPSPASKPSPATTAATVPPPPSRPQPQPQPQRVAQPPSDAFQRMDDDDELPM